MFALSLACDRERLAGESSDPHICGGDGGGLNLSDVPEVRAIGPVPPVDLFGIVVHLRMRHELYTQRLEPQPETADA